MIGGQGKDSNLRYDLRRITALASCCLRPLSHLSSNSYLTQPVASFRLWFGILVIDPPPTHVVPASSQFLKRFLNWFWNSLFPTAMKTESQSERSSWRKRHKISRYVEPLKTIASFKIPEAVIKPKRINKIRKPSFRTAFHCFGQKCIIRG